MRISDWSSDVCSSDLTGHEAEPVSERTRDRAGAGRRPDEGEPGEVEADRPRRRALAEDDVDLEVLHRGVEDLLADAREPVEIGRASCRERGCQDVYISVVAVSLKTKK